MIKISIKKPTKRKKNKTGKMITIFSLLFFIIISSLYLINRIITNDKIIQEVEKSSEIKIYKSLLPIRNWNTDYLNIEARSALVTYIDFEGNKKFVFEKNKDLKVPIASITKLMTALIVLDYYDLNETIIITEDAFNRDFFKTNNLYSKEEYRVKDLLYPLLMESNNTAAYALAQKIKSDSISSQSSFNLFIELMNKKAIELGMINTFFINPSGLDPSDSNAITNYSTAKDLVILIENLLEKPLIWEILSLPEYDIIRQDGFFKYTIINTNILLDQIPGMIGGKTGTTDRAQQCFILVTQKTNQEYIITIVLGSNDRFNETKKMIDWTREAYYWEINEWLNK